MKKEELIQEILNTHFPNPEIPLSHTSSYTFLIAVLLSAQCTDARVNLVTPYLFAKADTPEKMVKLPVSEVQSIIQSCGLSQTKSKAIHGLSQIIIEKHKGQVPNTFEDLESLPGVGHKTASVVMSQAFRVPAFPVDTHIHRLAKRWGLSTGKNVKKTEEDLKRRFAKKHWNKLHLQIIYYARKYCPARGHVIEDCPICSSLKNS